MKVGQIFDLPPDVTYYLGRIGKLKDANQTKVLAKYEVVQVEGELKGKVIVTYGNRRRIKHGS